VSGRIRKFAELYDALAEKPAGTAILFRDPETGAIRCHPVDKELVVGRLPKSERQPTACDLAVADSTLSREHFRITNADGLYLLSDLDSLNGTLVDDKRLPSGESVALIAGSMIRAGDVIFVFSGKT
jgi:predicted component of type VI protein secretion system